MYAGLQEELVDDSNQAFLNYLVSALSHLRSIVRIYIAMMNGKKRTNMPATGEKTKYAPKYASCNSVLCVLSIPKTFWK